MDPLAPDEVVVPREPTEEMLCAIESFADDENMGWREASAIKWRNVLKAAQKAMTDKPAPAPAHKDYMDNATSGSIPNTEATPFRKVFSQQGDFAATSAAERWLAANGYSVGSMQRDSPRGIMRGDYCIAKWRNLSSEDRAELDGELTGDGRNGPLTVTLKQSPRVPGDAQEKREGQMNKPQCAPAPEREGLPDTPAKQLIEDWRETLLAEPQYRRQKDEINALCNWALAASGSVPEREATADVREIAAAMLERHASGMDANGKRLLEKWPFTEDEARCRVLAALLVTEAATSLRMDKKLADINTLVARAHGLSTGNASKSTQEPSNPSAEREGLTMPETPELFSDAQRAELARLQRETPANSSTPLTDALAAESPPSCGLDEMAAQYNKMLEHARSLESSLQQAEIDSSEWQASYTQEQVKRIAAERSLAELRERAAKVADKATRKWGGQCCAETAREVAAAIRALNTEDKDGNL